MRVVSRRTILGFPFLNRPNRQIGYYLTQCHLSTTPSSSSFQPPPPPTSKGTPIYPDIDFSHAASPQSQGNIRNSDPNAVFVVTGANRGIGLQYVKTLLDRVEGKIVACCRDPNRASALQEVATSAATDDRVTILPLDVTDIIQIESLGSELKQRFGSRVDGLFNVAGVLGDGKSTSGPERSLSRIDPDWLRNSFEINVFGPTLLAQQLTPFMRTGLRGTSKDKDSQVVSSAKSVIVNMSARVGSISDNELGGWYSYRASKAALNQMTRTMSHELKRYGIYVVALHPGTTNTDLSRPFQKNVKEERLFPVEFTVGRMLDVVESLEDKHSGGFYDWAGKSLPF